MDAVMMLNVAEAMCFWDTRVFFCFGWFSFLLLLAWLLLFVTGSVECWLMI